MIRLKRVYEPASEQDGKRLLVERLWPRGVKKTSARLDGWLKEVSPSSALRTWFGHDATKWSMFRHRYFKELDSKPEAWEPILHAAKRGRVTLIYSSHDTEHNNAVALQQYLQSKVNTGSMSSSTESDRHKAA